MKTLTVLVLIFCILMGVIVSQKYTTKYDGINIKQLLNNNRLMGSYVKCLLGSGRCNREGLELRSVLPDALTTDCAKCSKDQKRISKTVIKYMIDKQRIWWNQLESKYDPSGVYRKKYVTEFNR